MIYVDTSVALAHLFAEDRVPPAGLWDDVLVSSRLLEYELWTVAHQRGLKGDRLELLRPLIGRLAFVELARPVLARALEPFPVPVRTLDALHLATIDYLRTQGQNVALASYDKKLLAAARRMGFEIAEV